MPTLTCPARSCAPGPLQVAGHLGDLKGGRRPQARAMGPSRRGERRKREEGGGVGERQLSPQALTYLLVLLR